MDSAADGGDSPLPEPPDPPDLLTLPSSFDKTSISKPISPLFFTSISTFQPSTSLAQALDLGSTASAYVSSGDTLVASLRILHVVCSLLWYQICLLHVGFKPNFGGQVVSPLSGQVPCISSPVRQSLGFFFSVVGAKLSIVTLLMVARRLYLPHPSNPPDLLPSSRPSLDYVLSSLSLGFVSPDRKDTPVFPDPRLLPTTALPVTPLSLMFSQVYSTAPSGAPPLESYWFRAGLVVLALWNMGLTRSNWVVSLAFLPSGGSITALVRIVTAECRLVTIVTVLLGVSRSYIFILGCEVSGQMFFAWKLHGSRCPLPQCEVISSSSCKDCESGLWDLRSLHRFGSSQIHLPRFAKPMDLQSHIPFPPSVFNWFKGDVRTSSYVLGGTKWCDKWIMDVVLLVGSTSWCSIARVLVADSLLMDSALTSAFSMDTRSPMVISDSEDLLPLLKSKDDTIARPLGVMYDSIGVFYVSRLIFIAAVPLALVALLFSLLNISSIFGV